MLLPSGRFFWRAFRRANALRRFEDFSESITVIVLSRGWGGDLFVVFNQRVNSIAVGANRYAAVLADPDADPAV